MILGSPGQPTSREDVQQRIIRIWQDVLRIDDLASDDDFFELGGHSLSASQIISRIRKELGVEVTLTSFFERPTVADLVETVMVAASEGPVDEPNGARRA